MNWVAFIALQSKKTINVYGIMPHVKQTPI